MNTTATLYDAARGPLTAILEAVEPEAWTRPSPCEGWSACDVVRHLIQTQRDLLTSHGVRIGDHRHIDSDPGRAWSDHSQSVLEVLCDDNVAAISYDGHFGRTTVGATLEQFYVWDMYVHRWDIARATGQDAGLTDAEMDRIAQGADSFGEALHLDGICKAGVEAPADADRLTRLLARLGRAV